MTQSTMTSHQPQTLPPQKQNPEKLAIQLLSTMTEVIAVFPEQTELSNEFIIDTFDYDESEEAKAMIVDFAMTRKRRRECKRSVSFIESVVSEVRERPRTEQRDVSILYYSATDIRRFRTEYREMVRRRIAERQQHINLGTPPVAVSNTVTSFMKSAMQLVKSIAGEAGIVAESSESNIFVDTLYLF